MNPSGSHRLNTQEDFWKAMFAENPDANFARINAHDPAQREMLKKFPVAYWQERILAEIRNPAANHRKTYATAVEILLESVEDLLVGPNEEKLKVELRGLVERSIGIVNINEQLVSRKIIEDLRNKLEKTKNDLNEQKEENKMQKSKYEAIQKEMRLLKINNEKSESTIVKELKAELKLADESKIKKDKESASLVRKLNELEDQLELSKNLKAARDAEIAREKSYIVSLEKDHKLVGTLKQELETAREIAASTESTLQKMISEINDLKNRLSAKSQELVELRKKTRNQKVVSPGNQTLVEKRNEFLKMKKILTDQSSENEKKLHKLEEENEILMTKMREQYEKNMQGTNEAIEAVQTNLEIIEEYLTFDTACLIPIPAIPPPFEEEPVKPARKEEDKEIDDFETCVVCWYRMSDAIALSCDVCQNHWHLNCTPDYFKTQQCPGCKSIKKN